MTIKSCVRITPDAIVSDRPVPVAEGSGKDMLVSAFRALGWLCEIPQDGYLVEGRVSCL